MHGDHIADVLVEGVVLPALVDLPLGVRVGTVHHHRPPHLARALGVMRRCDHTPLLLSSLQIILR